jgi:hypothetical protein
MLIQDLPLSKRQKDEMVARKSALGPAYMFTHLIKLMFLHLMQQVRSYLSQVTTSETGLP